MTSDGLGRLASSDGLIDGTIKDMATLADRRDFCKGRPASDCDTGHRHVTTGAEKTATAGMKKGCNLRTDCSLRNVVVQTPDVKLADEGLALQSRKARLRARSRVLVDQLLGGRLVKCLHNKAEFLVGSFLSWLFGNKTAELLDSSSQSSPLLAVPLTTNERSTK